jgi:hypothetical protein
MGMAPQSPSTADGWSWIPCVVVASTGPQGHMHSQRSTKLEACINWSVATAGGRQEVLRVIGQWAAMPCTSPPTTTITHTASHPNRHIRRTWKSLVRPYGFMQPSFADSVMGTSSGMPYTVHELENTMFFRPALRIAFKSVIVPCNCGGG